MGEMTFKEKLMKEYPEMVDDTYTAGVKGCPWQYGYDGAKLDVEGHCTVRKNMSCRACWNREIVETKSWEEVFEEVVEETEGTNPTCADAPHIKDSGERRQFETGAVRDIQEGKGRCDLMPLGVVGHILSNPTLSYVSKFLDTDNTRYLENALTASGVYHDIHTMFLEVAKHFEEGAKKYGENNWQKGLPVHCYIDSAVRHYLKWLRGDKDEPHDRAFVWNLMCCIWECDFSPRAKENFDGNQDNKS
jgi:hypothetical protein